MFKNAKNFFISFVKNSPVISVCAGAALLGIIMSMILYSETVSDAVTAMPLFISIIIMLLQSEANRYALLLGSLNSIFYAVVYFSFELHASALSALCLSLPIQMLTFFQWNKHKYKNSTMFRKLSWLMRGACLAAGVVSVFALNAVLGHLGSEYMILDNVGTVIGVAVYIFTFFSLVEFPVLQLIGGVIGSINYIIMIGDGKYTLIPYLIYSIFSLICVAKSAVSVRRLYREQQISSVKPAKEISK